MADKWRSIASPSSVTSINDMIATTSRALATMNHRQIMTTPLQKAVLNAAIANGLGTPNNKDCDESVMQRITGSLLSNKHGSYIPLYQSSSQQLYQLSKFGRGGVDIQASDLEDENAHGGESIGTISKFDCTP